MFKSKIPDDWVIREIGERDYGIDLFVEVPWEGLMRGWMCNIQLKGRDSLSWAEVEGDNCDECKLYSFKSSTANYLFGLPAPTFIVLTDNAEKRAFYRPLEGVVREQFDKTQTKDTFSITFYRDLELGTPLGTGIFLPLLLQEANRGEFEGAVVTFLSLTDHFFRVLTQHCNTDFHMMTDDEDALAFRHTYTILKTLSRYIVTEHKISDFDHFSAQCAKAFGGYPGDVYEIALQKFSEELLPVFVDVLRIASRLVTESEASYWYRVNLALLNKCGNIRHVLPRYEKEAQSTVEFLRQNRVKLDFETDKTQT